VEGVHDWTGQRVTVSEADRRDAGREPGKAGRLRGGVGGERSRPQPEPLVVEDRVADQQGAGGFVELAGLPASERKALRSALRRVAGNLGLAEG